LILEIEFLISEIEFLISEIDFLISEIEILKSLIQIKFCACLQLRICLLEFMSIRCMDYLPQFRTILIKFTTNLLLMCLLPLIKFTIQESLLLMGLELLGIVGKFN
jgi:hypothetical protein